MSDVPCDLVREILVNLPAKSVLRFRSVCKEWVRIMDDSYFIKAHAKNQLYNHTIVVGDEYQKTGAPLYSLCLDSLNFIMNGPQMIDATPIKNLSTSMATCNGLIMFTSMGGRDKFVIRNPLTKESHELPQLANDALVTNAYGYVYGFGYDSASDDYKVVRIDDLSCQGKVVFQTLVYSLRLNSWRKILDSPCRLGEWKGWEKEWKGSFLNGSLYWTSMTAIVALHLGTEKYSQLPLPNAVTSTNQYLFNLDLHAMDGCLICSLDYFRTSLFDGWVMKDNGVEKSWIKLFSLQYNFFCAPPPGLRLVAYLKRKHQVVLHHYFGGFYWFDIANNSLKKLSIHGRKIKSSLICPETLVRLSDYHGGDTTLPRKKKKKKTTKTKKTNTRLKFCVRNIEGSCCSDYNRICSEDSCWHCKEE